MDDRDPPGTGDSPLDGDEQPSSEPNTEQPNPQPTAPEESNPEVND